MPRGDEMELYAPEYYKEFRCIADKCKHSCCIGWEIDIDPESEKRYAAYSGGYGECVKSSVSTEGAAHFKTGADGRCPHLDERGLCRIITSLGENELCDICREHPRFYNLTPQGLEVGVGAACEAAARLILTSDGYDRIVKISEREEECDGAETVENGDPCEAFTGTLRIRESIFKLLRNTSLPYSERLSKIYELCGVSPSVLSDGEWREIIWGLEYLARDSAERFSAYTSSTHTEEGLGEPLSRFLAYLVYRHTGGCESEAELRCALGFAFFTERLFASLLKSEGTKEHIELCRLISEELEYSEDNSESIKLEFV